MSIPNPHHGQNTAVLLSCTYVFADVIFLPSAGVADGLATGEESTRL